jgi:hypothetical protein
MIPTQVLQGFEEDFHAAMLYRIQPPNWFNDALIRAVCVRLMQAHPTTRYCEISNPSAAHTATNISAIAAVAYLALEEGVETVLVPVNVANVHWCGIIVSNVDKTVRYYDSLNKQTHGRNLKAHCERIVDDHLPTYTVVGINSPIQQDGFSCGFLVCMKFWKHVDRSLVHDETAYSSLTRRFKLLHFVLTGSNP